MEEGKLRRDPPYHNALKESVAVMAVMALSYGLKNNIYGQTKQQALWEAISGLREVCRLLCAH